MSSRPLERLRRSIGVRLGLWYALIFTCSGAILFALVYFLFATAVEKKEQEILQTRLREYSAIYQSGGLLALQRWLRSNAESRGQQPFFVRLFDRGNDLVFARVPDDWVTFQDDGTDREGYRRQTGILRVPATRRRISPSPRWSCRMAPSCKSATSPTTARCS